MATPTYSVTLHHLAPGAAAAGLGYPDEQMPSVTAIQLGEMLQALARVASRLTIYEPSAPEIRIKTDRETYVIRTRYRSLCFVGRETLLRGEDHTVAFILETVSGLSEPEVKTITPRVMERPIPTLGSSRPPIGSGFPDWAKVALMLILSTGFLGGGLWMIFRSPPSLAPKFTLLPEADSVALLNRVSGEYHTGTAEGDRRLIIGSDGTLRIAKYGPAKVIVEEIIRTARGATQDGQPALSTNDPYVMIIKGSDTVELYGQNYTRVVR